MTDPLSEAAFQMLLALSDRPRHGLGVAAEVESRTRGRVILGASTLYTAFRRMRDDGWIAEVDAPMGERGSHLAQNLRVTKSPPSGREHAEDPTHERFEPVSARHVGAGSAELLFPVLPAAQPSGNSRPEAAPSTARVCTHPEDSSYQPRRRRSSSTDSRSAPEPSPDTAGPESQAPRRAASL